MLFWGGDTGRDNNNVKLKLWKAVSTRVLHLLPKKHQGCSLLQGQPMVLQKQGELWRCIDFVICFPGPRLLSKVSCHWSSIKLGLWTLCAPWPCADTNRSMFCFQLEYFFCASWVRVWSAQPTEACLLHAPASAALPKRAVRRALPWQCAPAQPQLASPP